MSKTITVDVPQGLGDIFWVHQKLFPHFDVVNYNIMVMDNSTVATRSLLWPAVWSKVGDVECKQVTASTYHAVAETYHPLADLLDKDHAAYAVNRPLEQGIRLEDTDPYPVAWDVPMKTEPFALPWSSFWAVYVSGSLQQWTLAHWMDFLTRLDKSKPLALLGASFDTHATIPLVKHLQAKGYQAEAFIDLPPARVLYLLQQAEYFVGYQSGLGVMADHLGTPQYMLYFQWYEKLMYSWCRPAHVKTKFHAGTFALKPETAAREIARLTTT